MTDALLMYIQVADHIAEGFAGSKSTMQAPICILYCQKGCDVTINGNTKRLELEVGVASDNRIGCLGLVRGEIDSLAESMPITVVPDHGFAYSRPDSFLDLIQRHLPSF